MGGGGGGMRGSRFSSGIFGDDMFASFGEGRGSMNQGASRKAPPIENRLPCSFEELYNGATKKMKISREIADISG
jgi:DnaJ family protein B protein 4